MMSEIRQLVGRAALDAQSIAEATRTWFAFLGTEQGRMNSEARRAYSRRSDRRGAPRDHRTTAPRQERGHVPWRLRSRPSRPSGATSPMQEQGRHPGRQPDQRSAHHEIANTVLRAPGAARPQPRRLEMVDYVIIDEEAQPLRNLERLQPDFFAKGYEYQNGGLHPRTQREIEVLAAYGARSSSRRATSSIRPHT